MCFLFFGHSELFRHSLVRLACVTSKRLSNRARSLSRFLILTPCVLNYSSACYAGYGEITCPAGIQNQISSSNSKHITQTESGLSVVSLTPSPAETAVLSCKASCSAPKSQRKTYKIYCKILNTMLIN